LTYIGESDIIRVWKELKWLNFEITTLLPYGYERQSRPRHDGPEV
jgi:hypothetical protein